MHESWKICHDRKRWNEVQELRSPSRARQEQLSGRSPWHPNPFCWQGDKILRWEGVYSAGNREPWLLYCIKELRGESDADIQGIFQEKTDIDLCKIQSLKARNPWGWLWLIKSQNVKIHSPCMFVIFLRKLLQIYVLLCHRELAFLWLVLPYLYPPIY